MMIVFSPTTNPEKLRYDVKRYSDYIIKNGKAPKVLYHYTSIDSLYNILHKNQIWLGIVSASNDKKELIEFYEKLRDDSFQEIKSSSQSIHKIFFDKLHDRILNEYPYVFCLSRRHDDAAQWERYADNGHGVCISFNVQYLLQTFYPINGHLYSVDYHFNPKKSSLLNDVIKYLDNFKLNDDQDEDELMTNLIINASLYKHKGFETESEIRSVILSSKTLPALPMIDCYKVESECVNKRIKRFLKIDLGIIFDILKINIEDLIDRITVGPCSRQDKLELEWYIGEELGYKKLAKCIKISECPLQPK